MKVIKLSAGRHKNAEHGTCLMEAVSVLAGEEFTDHPQCACPTITGLGIVINDLADDELRQTLLGGLPWRLINTVGDIDIASRRLKMFTDWLFPVINKSLLMTLDWSTAEARKQSIQEIAKLIYINEDSCVFRHAFAAPEAHRALDCVVSMLNHIQQGNARVDAMRDNLVMATHYLIRHFKDENDHRLVNEILTSAHDLLIKMVELTEIKEQGILPAATEQPALTF